MSSIDNTQMCGDEIATFCDERGVCILYGEGLWMVYLYDNKRQIASSPSFHDIIQIVRNW